MVLAGYYSLDRKKQNLWLLGASYIFYSFWDWRFLGLIIASTVVDFFCGKFIAGAGANKRRRKIWLLVSVFTNLGILATFKYFNFFLSSLIDLGTSIGFQMNTYSLEIILPIGISFYTFQTLSYTIDIYRGELKPTTKFANFAVFVAFFPQLVAGPIERARRLLPQFENTRDISIEKFFSGTLLITVGLFKKVVLADNAAVYVDSVFANPSLYSSSGLFIATLLFSVQIYCDFSAYSDIARGTARLLGFDLMINFRQPYFSKSITEFWRRWHISLSTWLRDYLYIPLGGNRFGIVNTYRNNFITMLIGGLWHGAAWGFVLWGALHGAYLAIHKFMLESKPLVRHPTPLIDTLKILGVFVLVSLTWIPFRQPELIFAYEFFVKMISFQGPIFDVANPGKVLEPGLVLVACMACILAIDIPNYRKNSDLALYEVGFLLKGIAYSLMVLGLMVFGGDNESAFIYFQF